MKPGDLVQHRYLKNYIGIIIYIEEKENYYLPAWQLPEVIACVWWGGQNEMFFILDVLEQVYY